MMAAPTYIQAQLNAAQKFLQAMLTSPAIADQYAAQMQSNPGGIGAWLASIGYADIDSTVIYIALEQIRDVSQAFWTGIYGMTYMSTDSKTWINGPVLIIEGDSTVLLDDVAIINPVYAKSVLQWTNVGNATVAQLAFTQITGVTNAPLPAGTYIGNKFIGTLTQDGISYTVWSGQIGTRPSYTPPAAYKAPVWQTVLQYVGYVVMIGAALQMGYKVGDWCIQKIKALRDARNEADPDDEGLDEADAEVEPADAADPPVAEDPIVDPVVTTEVTEVTEVVEVVEVVDVIEIVLVEDLAEPKK